MGFLKKVTSSIFGGGTPKYNQDQSALTQQYGVISDLGNLNLVKNADGTYSKSLHQAKLTICVTLWLVRV